jgi:hypothetical protein
MRFEFETALDYTATYSDREAMHTRLYSDEKGESHFEDVEIDLTLTDYAPPAAPLALSAFTPATQFGFMQAPAGWESDWHPSSARNFFVVLSGEWEVTASNGETRRFGAGSILLVEDTTGKGHMSRVVSECDSVAVMIELPNKS